MADTPPTRENVRSPPTRCDGISGIDDTLRSKEFLLFDIDGTIANTESTHWVAHNAMLKRYGVLIGHDQIVRYAGNTDHKIYDMIEKEFNVTVTDRESFFRERFEIYLELLVKNDIIPNRYFLDILSKYPEKSYGILSSQPNWVIDRVLDLWKVSHMFPAENRMSAFDGRTPKKTVLADIEDHFVMKNGNKVTRKDTVLFEDSEHTMKMAYENFVDCIGIEHMYNEGMLLHCLRIIDESGK
jgi:beta-phosphoglucomutase-like phosphatase (HAD superfamily)